MKNIFWIDLSKDIGKKFILYLNSERKYLLSEIYNK